MYVSPYLFAENVMVSVATRTASNPLAKLADTIRVSPPPTLARTIALPAKLILPSWSGHGGTILGALRKEGIGARGGRSVANLCVPATLL